MTSDGHEVYEYRRLRDAAKRNLAADLDHIKYSLTSKTIAERTFSRVANGAEEVLESAKEAAQDHKGIVAALVGALILWFTRQPILEALFGDDEDIDEGIESEPRQDFEIGDDDEHGD